MTTNTQMFTIDITLADGSHGKLAEATILFGGPWTGLELTGFTVWEGRNGDGANVTFPARKYESKGEQRTFSFVRSTKRGDKAPMTKLRDAILAAYHEALDASTEGIAAACRSFEKSDLATPKGISEPG